MDLPRTDGGGEPRKSPTAPPLVCSVAYLIPRLELPWNTSSLIGPARARAVSADCTRLLHLPVLAPPSHPLFPIPVGHTRLGLDPVGHIGYAPRIEYLNRLIATERDGFFSFALLRPGTSDGLL